MHTKHKITEIQSSNTSRSGTFSFFLFPAYWNDGGNFKGSFHKAIFLSNSKRCFEQKPIFLQESSTTVGQPLEKRPFFLANQHNGVLMKIFESLGQDLWDSMLGNRVGRTNQYTTYYTQYREGVRGISRE